VPASAGDSLFADIAKQGRRDLIRNQQRQKDA